MGIVLERKLLDHGYIRVVESWGSDERIVEAARMSTDKGFVSWDPYEGHPRGDVGLLDYMMRHGHGTPFEMAGLIVEVQAPIFAFREWHRHRTQGYNELSARYTAMPDLNYIPTVERLMMGGGHLTKQAGTVDGAAVLTREGATWYREALARSYNDAQVLYESALAEGIPKELARIHLPVGRYSRMRATANLRNWFGFSTLRSPTTAQWEIRQYSHALDEFLAELFPRSYGVFNANRGAK